MKLRFRQNTLRLRLNQREVERLTAGEALREEVRFPGATRLAYMLEPGEQTGSHASYADDLIRVRASQNDLAAWAQSADLGFYFRVPVGGAVLEIAIEKDLECVDGPEAERDPHAFPRDAAKRC